MSNLKNILNSFKIKNNLCPEVWDTTEEGYVLKKNIREKLLQIAYEFFDSLGVDVIISDITFTGSLANYNWSNFSDIDLHLIADFKQFDEEDLELFKELFLLKKTIFNDKHDIKILGYEVELYVQDENEEHTSTGVYSVLNNEWIVEPKKEIEKIDANFIKKKSENWMKEIDSVIELSKEESLEDAKKLIKKFKEKIKKYRSCGLEKGGEYSIENLVFKVLRRNGYIEKLFDTSNKLVDDKLSIKEEEEVKDPDLTTSEKSDIIDPDIEKFYDSLEKIDSNVYQQERGSYTYQKDVESIQIALDLLGYPLPRFGVDGKFGPETAKAVNDFKKDNNIDDTPVKTESFNNETYFKNLIKESLNIQKKIISESVYKSPAKNGTFKIRHPFKEVRKTKNLKKYPEGFRYHWGVDVEAAQESELIAMEDGVVVTATDGAGGCGGMLEICLTSGVRVKFCHMHKMYVSKGDKVVKDQVVGLVGGDSSDPKSKRGNTSSAHIHMEMYDSCTSRNHIDPYDYIKGAVYVGSALKQKGNVEQKPGEEIKSAEEQGFFSKIFGSLFGGKDEKTKEGMSFVSPEMADKLIEKLKEKEIKTGDIQKYTNVKNKKYPVELITGDVKIKGNFSGEALKNIQIMIDKLNKIGITNPYAQVGVLSVIGKESNFIPKSEWCHENSSNSYLRSIFKERLDDYNDDELTELKKDCEKFFDAVYGKDADIGWNTGNTEKGDGFKYRGRGFNQLTFKHNYEKFGNIIGKDLVGNPDLVNDTEIAAEVAVQFFTVNAKGNIPNFDNKEDAIEFFANINAGGGKSSHLESALESGKRFDVVV